MAAFKTPYTPVFTYDSGLSETNITIENGITDPFVYPLPAPSRLKTAGTLLVEALTAYNDEYTGAALTVQLNYSNEGILKYVIIFTGDDDITITFGSLAIARRYGINSTTATLNEGLLNSYSNTLNFAGHWTPFCLTLREQQNNQATIVATDGLTYEPVNVIQWGANTQYVDYDIYYCKAANILDYRAADTRFATPAGRSINDVYNTYEKFIEGVRADNQGRAAVWFAEDGGTPVNFTIDVLYQLSIYRNLDDLLQNLEDVSSGRLWHVKFGARILE